jgi:biopolymer transport protein ExbB/TolQ
LANQTTQNPPAGPTVEAIQAEPALITDRLVGSRRDNIDLLKAMFLGVVVTALFYEVFPLPFIEHGRILAVFDNPISEVITGMSFWSLFMLLFKYLHFRVQMRAQLAFGRSSMRTVLSQGIYARNVDDVLRQLGGELRALKVKKFADSAIYRRVYQVLHYIRSAPKKETLNDLLGYQSQIDLKRLETGYTILQVFIWAIPILGFIGTVLGIGDSVREFSVFIQTAEGGAQFSTQMRTALGGVTTGLAVAFNTTFLALVLVMPIMVITSFLQKSEEEILVAVEEYCLEELLPHLHISPSDEGIKETFDEHMHRILRLSSNWLGQLEPLVQQLSRQTEMVSHQIGGIQPLVKDFTDRLLADKGQAARPAARRGGASARPAGAAKAPAARKASAAAKPRRRTATTGKRS